MVTIPNTEEDFWACVNVGGPDDCWPWTKAVVKSTGYGQMSMSTLGGNRSAHSLAYEFTHGSIPLVSGGAGTKRMQLDHICHNKDVSCAGGVSCRHRLCCNPNHLEVVTNKENRRRANETRKLGQYKTHCVNSHEYTEENTQWANQKLKDGSYVCNRRCAQCNRDKATANKLKKR